MMYDWYADDNETFFRGEKVQMEKPEGAVHKEGTGTVCDLRRAAKRKAERKPAADLFSVPPAKPLNSEPPKRNLQERVVDLEEAICPKVAARLTAIEKMLGIK